jgi:hypothetical protein
MYAGGTICTMEFFPRIILYLYNDFVELTCASNSPEFSLKIESSVKYFPNL